MKHILFFAVIMAAATLAGCAEQLQENKETAQTPHELEADDAAPQAIFDFNTGLPALSAGQSTPLNQTSGGVTAHFTSPFDPAAFSVQNHDTTFFVLSLFSGNYLYQNQIFKTPLDIEFSQPLSAINLTFATIELEGAGNVDVPSSITLTAYLDSEGTIPVGTSVARGSYLDAYPQGVLSFDSAGRPFKLVRIELQPRHGVAGAATAFLVDSARVTKMEAGSAVIKK